MASPEFPLFNDTDLQLLAKLVNNVAVMAVAAGGSPQYPEFYDTREQLNSKLVYNVGLVSAGGSGGAVSSVNGQIGAVVLTAADVGAAADSLGEVITKAQVGPVSVLNGTPKSIGYLDLPIGTWRVNSAAGFGQSGGTAQITYVEASLSIIDNTPDYTQDYADFGNFTAGALTGGDFLKPSALLTLAAPTRVFLVCVANYGAASVNFYAIISAERVASITVQA